MFKSKSFRLISDEEAKKQREKLCEPQKFYWTKCLSVPILIRFMLLLILTNMNCAGNAYATTIAATTTLITNKTQNIARSSTNCREKNCYISCTDGTIENLYEEIGSFASRCDQIFEVRLEYCKFSHGIMGAKFFTGNYRLKSFVIYDCDLAKIEANTFKQASVTDLTNMTFIKTNINSLNELTFLGLASLEYFTIINNKIYTTFNGVGFLESLSDTITEVVVQQLSDKNKKYDPTNWLKSKRDQTKLINVDLSGNIFHDTLTSVTFANLVQVQRLILSNSYITTIEIGTFDKIIKTLSYLDLSVNQLTTLSGDFLTTNSVTGLHMELHDNAWNCDCANCELVKFIKKSEIESTVAPKCSTPKELKDANIKLITLECDNETTTAKPLPPSTTEAAKTTTKITQTTMSTKTTEHTPTEPDVTYESDQPINTSERVEITSKTAEPTTTETQKTSKKLETTEFTVPIDESDDITQYTESDFTDKSDQTDESNDTSEPVEITKKNTQTTMSTKATTPTTIESDSTAESDQTDESSNTSRPLETTTKTTQTTMFTKTTKPTFTETQKTTVKQETTNESDETTQYTEPDYTDESDETDESSNTSEPVEITIKITETTMSTKTTEPTTTETQKTSENLETTEFTEDSTQYTDSDSPDESYQTNSTKSITSISVEKYTVTFPTTINSIRPSTTTTIRTTDTTPSTDSGFTAGKNNFCIGITIFILYFFHKYVIGRF